jgi:acetyl-CoA carboxylase biotin carboxyl carrier protein
MSLSHEDVQHLLQLLDASQFDELYLESDGVKLSLRRNGAVGTSHAAAAAVASNGQAAATQSRAAPAAPSAAAAPVPAPEATSAAGLLEIRSPMLGTFYSAPKPGAAPFVAPGDRVSPETAVAIIEVMKLMNSVAAGVSGVVVEVLARDGQLVEFDQLLMRVRPQ